MQFLGIGGVSGWLPSFPYLHLHGGASTKKVKKPSCPLHPILIVHFAFQVEPTGIGVTGDGVCSWLGPFAA
jgi:hypothetical protein